MKVEEEEEKQKKTRKTKIEDMFLVWEENVSCKLFINTITWILLRQKMVIKTGKE